MKKVRLFTKALLMLCMICTMSSFLTSCQSKEERVISNLQSLVEKVEQKGDDFTEDEWAEIIDDFQRITTEDIQECDFSSKQLKEIGKLEGKFAIKAGSAYTSRFGTKLNNLFNQAEGLFDGLLEGITEELEE